jgi:hypothetical protein
MSSGAAEGKLKRAKPIWCISSEMLNETIARAQVSTSPSRTGR